MIAQADLIIWDEVPMQHHHNIDCVERTLREFCGRQEPFGGITVAFGGDFQQTLPVVEKGTREQIVKACLQKSTLWRRIEILHLRQNMRVDAQDPQSHGFAEWLLEIGSGRNLPPDSMIPLRPHMQVGFEIKDLVNTVYPNLNDMPDEFFLDRAILCARNAEVDEINEFVQNRFPGQVRVFNSADTMHDDKDRVDADIPYPTDYLTSVSLNGMPPSKLELKIGMPLMLLRNLDPGQGLCNGTRLRVHQMSNRVLHVRIITGPGAGKYAFIPRITLNSGTQLPFILYCRQFPVRVAFAMTINKSQGQSLGMVGIDLRFEVFSHGQLYVALSRGRNERRVKVLLDKEKTKTVNVVYPEVLL